MVDIIFNFNLAAKVRGYGENVNWFTGNSDEINLSAYFVNSNNSFTFFLSFLGLSIIIGFSQFK